MSCSPEAGRFGTLKAILSTRLHSVIQKLAQLVPAELSSMISQWNCSELNMGEVLNHLKKPQQLWHLLPPLKEPGVGEVGHTHLFASLSLGHFQGSVSQEGWEHRVLASWQGKRMHIENSLLHVLSVSPYPSGGVTSIFLNHYFRIVSPAIGAVQRTVRHSGRGRMELWNWVCVCLSHVQRETRHVANTRFWQRMGDIDCLVSVDYSHF